jgi:phosphoglucomutase
MIHFDTSGRRGIVADDFTFRRVRRAAAAIAADVQTQEKSPLIIVGYDTRFISPEFAQAAAWAFKERAQKARARG